MAKISKLEKAEWYQRDSGKDCLFLPPAVFSRMDGPQVRKFFFNKLINVDEGPFCTTIKITGMGNLSYLVVRVCFFFT